MIITVNNKELDISTGSHFFCRDEDGKEIFKEWTELDLESRKELSELAERVEDIMLEATGFLEREG